MNPLLTAQTHESDEKEHEGVPTGRRCSSGATVGRSEVDPHEPETPMAHPVEDDTLDLRRREVDLRVIERLSDDEASVSNGSRQTADLITKFEKS